MRGRRTGGSKPLPSRKPCIPGGTFRWWPMYYMISLLIKLVRTRWLDILTHFVSRFHEMRRSKGWPIRDLLDMAKGKLLHYKERVCQWCSETITPTEKQLWSDSDFLSIFESPVIHSVCPQGFALVSTRVRKSKRVLDSGFHAVDSWFPVLDSGFFVHETWIPDSNRLWIPDSLSCIPDSKAHDSWFYKQKFRG